MSEWPSDLRQTGDAMIPAVTIGAMAVYSHIWLSIDDSIRVGDRRIPMPEGARRHGPFLLGVPAPPDAPDAVAMILLADDTEPDEPTRRWQAEDIGQVVVCGRCGRGRAYLIAAQSGSFTVHMRTSSWVARPCRIVVASDGRVSAIDAETGAELPPGFEPRPFRQLTFWDWR